MRIINLIENTEGRSGCAYAHGLSFYVETKKHRMLLDLGPSGQTLQNAKVLDIDLTRVDTVILSHGHYDHSGGILPFAGINDQALIYMQGSATGEYYSDRGKSAPQRYEYIGIDKNIAELPQVRFLQGDYRIDDELELFTIKNRSHKLPSSNKRILIRKGDHFQCDDFVHEQFLVVSQGSQDSQDPWRVLMSGCAHSGILSIMDAFCEKYGKEPDLVISGFHLMKKTDYTGDEIREIEEIAKELTRYPTKFVTCHCTGIPAFDRMKTIMGDQLAYVHSGEEINLSFIGQG
jgi:7,8-dihydropterin-6-yl-methyl-4-(beta-D-ribofuranosyl)aminobenzene 5'-phosphate synthase